MPQLLGEWNTPNDGKAWLVDFKTIDDELRYLRSMVTKYRQAPDVRAKAVAIIKEANCQMRDKKAQALAIAQWVQDHVYYVHELPERFSTPDNTLRTLAGDCDDFTTLIGSMCESLGIPSVLVTMKINGAWAHIFPAVKLPGGLLPLDATMKTNVADSPNPVDFARARGKAVALKMA